MPPTRRSSLPARPTWRRLEELQSYEKVYAPFDGVITARNTDVGDLINAGAGTPNTQLFHMMATQTLRIYVAVPEIDAPSIHVGATPTVTLDEYPGEVFHGHLVRTDNAINPVSRTTQVEVDVDNSAGKLLPGAYAFVHFTLPGRTAVGHHSVQCPAVSQRRPASRRGAQRHRETGTDHHRP